MSEMRQPPPKKEMRQPRFQGVMVVDFNMNITCKNSLMAQMVKNLPVMQEIQVQSLGQEDPLEKGMATHFTILAWEIPWTEDPVEL